MKSGKISRQALPGEFIHVRMARDDGILLRRPFSLLEAEEGTVSFVYKIVGMGTNDLSKRKKGEFINVVGPLGNPYVFIKNSKRVILVAGGYGVSPTYFLARRMKDGKFKGEIISILGARNKLLLLYENEFKKLGVRTFVTTDDGSAGRKGIVTDVLKQMLEGTSASRHIGAEGSATQVFSCGPLAMLKAVAMTCEKFSVPCQVSMEQQLGCGLGVCLGCVIKTTRGYERVCTEGPVFNAEDVIWE